MDDAAFATAKTAIEESTLAQLVTAAETYGVGDYTDGMSALITAQKSADEACTALASAKALNKVIGADTTPTAGDVTKAIKKLIGSKGEGIEQDTESTNGMKVYISGGAVGAIAAQIGKYQLYSLSTLGTVYAGAKKGDATGHYNGVVTSVNELTIENGNTASANITDTYGYIIDFAFRTNAAESNLQLQTTAVNRVYSDQQAADLVTQGHGSTVTYTYAAGMTETQVNKLMSAIKLVFLSADNGKVYATAGLKNVKVVNGVATADVRLDTQAEDSATGTIMPLEQNTATKVSVLVYLDGNTVDNSAVINASSSGDLKLNLQFSSSATLIPMKNTALQTMQLTYTEIKLTDNKYTYNGAEYTVKEGKTLYKGNDGAVYFATTVTQGEPTDYTKLTATNMSTVLTKADSPAPESGS